MLYYDGEHTTVRIAKFQAYDDDCPEHEMWAPVRQTAVSDATPVGEAIQNWMKELNAQEVTLCLMNDCFVDYVSRRDNDERFSVLLPGRKVADKVTSEKFFDGLPLSSLYQHEYRHIDASFPYPALTLAQIGVPQHDIVYVIADGKDYYLEMKSGK